MGCTVSTFGPTPKAEARLASTKLTELGMNWPECVLADTTKQLNEQIRDDRQSLSYQASRNSCNLLMRQSLLLQNHHYVASWNVKTDFDDTVAVHNEASHK